MLSEPKRIVTGTVCRKEPQPARLIRLHHLLLLKYRSNEQDRQILAMFPSGMYTRIKIEKLINDLEIRRLNWPIESLNVA